jgi:hypothetical protein
MTWGNKLLLVFVGFAVLIGTLVYKCMQQNFELVSKDYYNDELRYQDKIDGVQNANKISSIQIAQTSEEVSIQLPKELNGLVTTGQVWFYCARSASNDRKILLAIDEDGITKISKSKLARTNYQVKVSWQTGSDKFYNEQSLEVR